MLQNLKYISSGRRKETIQVLLWEIFHSVLIAAPSGVLLVIIWELFSETPDTNKIWTVVGWMAVMLVVQFFVASKTMVKSNLLVYSISNDLRIQLGNKIRRFSLGFFKQRDPGDIASVILQDVASFEAIFGHSVGNIASAVFGTIVLSVFLIIYDWRLALCLLAVLPLVYPFLLIANFFVKTLGKKQIAARNASGSKFLEYVQGIRHLKSYGLTGAKYTTLETAFDDLRKNSIRLEAVPGPFIIMAGIIFELGFMLMVALGIYYLSDNSITIPVLITFLIMGYNLYYPLKILMVDYLVLRYMNENLNRITEVLKAPTMDTGTETCPDKFDIHFEDVSFGYQEHLLTLKNLNFTIPEKSMLALVGHSGSGKTTIASLIARFWDVSSGKITIGGKDIRNISQEDYYQMISEVFQEVYLFDDSIYNNIKIGKPDATEEEIEKVIKSAQCEEFISELPNGIHTQTGEAGSKLSGGQKQRISIARALLKDAPIVLLDEATASLDPENEIYIQSAIQELVKSKTVVVIAHKLATIQHADQIIVLDKGEISERGTHQELLENNAIYHKMWQLQQKSGGWKFSGNNQF